MSEIDKKYEELKNKGLDLGAASGPEEESAAGGRMRAYEHGHIYWSPATGAHEVHGGILDLYLKNGGPGNSPITGGRDLGYPVSDEEEYVLSVPYSRFETGAIYWSPGTNGCVLYGLIYHYYKRHGGSPPVTGVIDLAGGEAVFFAGGVIYLPDGATGVTQPIIGGFEFPLMGQPGIVDPADWVSRGLGFQVRWNEMKKETYNALIAWRAGVFSDIVRGRFAVAPSESPFSQIQLTETGIRLVEETPFFTDVVATFQVFPGGSLDIKERTLYDLQLNLPHGVPYALSPHCFYVKSDWDNFGLLHITDLHICARNQRFRSMLEQRGLNEAAQNYSNFQDNFADFIKYANRLHALGLADAVVATGDLVDYVAEDHDIFGEENFERLRRMILGEPFLPGMSAGERLKIPIYMTFGNHDYRLNSYDLVADLDFPGEGKDRGLNEHSAHNLLENEALALQDGKTPEYGVSNLEGAGRMIEYDRFDNRYHYFNKHFTNERTFIVRLGKHRLVVMDTRMDNGVPDDFDLLTLLNIAFGGPGFFESQFGGGMPATRKLLAGGGSDSVGLYKKDLALLRQAISEAGPDGLVIVGMHCPAISPKGSEYPYFHRETIHPTVDPALTDAYLQRHEISDGSSWTKTGTPYFKVGTVADGMDSGVIAYGGQEFLEICAGLGLPRPVDLVLWGHHHDRVEYRIKWNNMAGTMEYYMDFYSENPKSYYHTINGADIPGARLLPKNAVLQVRVEQGIPLPVAIGVVSDHRINATYGVARTPAYAEPLNSSSAPKDWWNRHRPLLAQTSALGPIDPRQRFGKIYKLHPPQKQFRPKVETDGVPDAPRGTSIEELPGILVPPTFQGFRLIQVRDGVIARMRYIVLRDLRRDKFSTPWEGDFRGPFGGIFDRTLIGGTAEIPSPEKPIIGTFHRVRSSRP
jgi:hypothetical protein